MFHDCICVTRFRKYLIKMFFFFWGGLFFIYLLVSDRLSPDSVLGFPKVICTVFEKKRSRAKDFKHQLLENKAVVEADYDTIKNRCCMMTLVG